MCICILTLYIIVRFTHAYSFFFFFFQAEDGIRDYKVTGVQTCALPISYQFAVSTPFGLHPSVHPRSPPPGEYACVPSFPSRQESAGKSQAPPPQTPPAAPA